MSQTRIQNGAKQVWSPPQKWRRESAVRELVGGALTSDQQDDLDMAYCGLVQTTLVECLVLGDDQGAAWCRETLRAFRMLMPATRALDAELLTLEARILKAKSLPALTAAQTEALHALRARSADITLAFQEFNRE